MLKRMNITSGLLLAWILPGDGSRGGLVRSDTSIEFDPQLGDGLFDRSSL
jgi:hypothetical protein